MTKRARLIWLNDLTGLAALAVYMPSVAHAQQIGTGQPIDLPIIRLVVGLALCSFIALAAALVMKRFFGARTPSLGKLAGGTWLRGAARRVTVIETRRLSPHADVCRLTCADKEYLVVISPGGATLLSQTDIGDASQVDGSVEEAH